MTFACTLSGELVALDPAVIEAFASRLTGRVLVESAAEYEQPRRVCNGLIDKRPAVIVRCSGVADVLDSLRFARHHNLLVAVRGGGTTSPASAPVIAAWSSTSRRFEASASIPQSARCGRRPGSGGATSTARRRCSVSLYPVASCRRPASPASRSAAARGGYAACTA